MATRTPAVGAQRARHVPSVNGVPPSGAAPSPDVAWMEVTPALARRWLNVPAVKRHCKFRTIEAYTKRMGNGVWGDYTTNPPGTKGGGRWLDYHADPVMLGPKEEVLNGQHRLEALMRSNVTVHMLVVRFPVMPSTAYLTSLDRGAVRTTRDVLTLGTQQALGVSSRTAAIAKAMWFGFRTQTAAPDDTEFVDFFIKYEAQIGAVLRYYGVHREPTGSSKLLGCCARALLHLPDVSVMRFLEVMHGGLSGANPAEATIIYFRNWVIKTGKYLHSQVGRQELYAKTSWTLDKFHRGEAVKKIFPADRELFPLAEDLVVPGEDAAEEA